MNAPAQKIVGFNMNAPVKKIRDTLFNPSIDSIEIDREVRLEVDREVWHPVWLNVSDQVSRPTESAISSMMGRHMWSLEDGR